MHLLATILGWGLFFGTQLLLCTLFDIGKSQVDGAILVHFVIMAPISFFVYIWVAGDSI